MFTSSKINLTVMKPLRILLLALFLSPAVLANADFSQSALHRYLSAPSADEVNWVQEDLERILQQAQLPKDFIRFEKLTTKNEANTATLGCNKKGLQIKVYAIEQEWSATLYKALRQLGFLFPHPSRQISPSRNEILRHCGQNVTWQARFPIRGFHLHNQHPNEWVQSLYLDDGSKMLDFVRWLKRNQQNLLQIQKIQVDETQFSNHLAAVLNEAHRAKIISSISISFSLYQQNSYHLLPWYIALTGWNDEEYIREGIQELRKQYEFQILTFELGTTEFTSAPYKKTLRWIEAARVELAKQDQMIFNKIHASSNQQKEPYGNFNYIPQFSHDDVGVLPHTVMAYSLSDETAPVYGLDNFASMKDYLIEQSQKRPTIYYPETSYYISMDIDLPLFLTDYLVARSHDMDLIEKHSTWGQVNFTTGQDMGYWMMDWTVALLVDTEYAGQPLIGMKLLGEDTKVWTEITDFQTKHFKKQQLIQALSFSNLQDELNVLGKAFFVHMRKLLRDYYYDPQAEELKHEIAKLDAAIDAMPDTHKIHSDELRILMRVTFQRLKHATYLRKFLAGIKPSVPLANAPESDSYLWRARIAREEALDLLKDYKDKYLDHSNSLVDSCQDNPTSYTCGYAWTALNLYHWEREEEMVEKKIYNPFYKNFYEALRIIF